MEILNFRKQCHVNAFGFALGFRQILPDFLGGENENGRSEADECAGNLPNGSLRGAARFISESLGVQPILQHVEIEGTEIDDAVVVDGMVDAVEFVI